MQLKTQHEVDTFSAFAGESKSGRVYARTKSESSGVSKVRILIVDDHPVMRQGIARLIDQERDMVICGELADGSKVMSCVPTLKPDLVVIDLSLPGKSGLELLKELRALDSSLPILIYSMHEETVYAKRVIRMGASGYVMKTEDSQKLIQAIRHILSGNIYVSDQIASELLRKLSEGKPQRHQGMFEQLSDREFEIFQLIGQGKDTREIASQLNVSTKTVDVHRMNIKEKLKLKTSVELIHLAVRSRASLQ